MSGWPKTVEGAATRVLERLSAGDVERLAGMEERELVRLHHGLGRWIRNNLGLWQGNRELKRATGKIHPDDASGVIIKAAWRAAREGGRATAAEEKVE